MNTPLNVTIPKTVPPNYQKYLAYLFPFGAGLAFLIMAGLIFVPGLSPQLMSDLLPTYSILASHNDTINQQAARVQRMQQKSSLLDQLDQAKLTANLAKVEDAIPDDRDVANTLAIVNQIATASGTTLSNASFLSTQTADPNAATYQLSLRGAYPAVKDFLVKLENAKRIMTVKSVNISLADAGNVTADMIIFSYFEPLPKVAADDTPLAQVSAVHDKLLTSLDTRTNYPSPVPATTAAGRPDPFASF